MLRAIMGAAAWAGRPAATAGSVGTDRVRRAPGLLKPVTTPADNAGV